MNEIQQTLLVTRNGSIDREHYAELDAEARREALHELGRKTLQVVAHTPIVLGRGLIWLVCHEGQNA